MPREMFILEFRMNARHSYTSVLDCGKLPVSFDRITMTTSIRALDLRLWSCKSSNRSASSPSAFGAVSSRSFS